MSASNQNPEGVVGRLLRGVCALVSGDQSTAMTRAEELASLYAEHCHVEHPMAPFGAVPLRSRDQLREHFAAPPGPEDTPIAQMEATDVRVHQTTEPDVVVAEFVYVIHSGGRATSVPCVFVLRFNDGLIIESRDYVDHLAFARATGSASQLATAIAANADAR